MPFLWIILFLDIYHCRVLVHLLFVCLIAWLLVFLPHWSASSMRIFSHFAPLCSKPKAQLEHSPLNIHLPVTFQLLPNRTLFWYNIPWETLLPQERFVYFYNSTKFTTSLSRTTCSCFTVLRNLLLGREHGKLSQSAVHVIPRVSACLRDLPACSLHGSRPGSSACLVAAAWHVKAMHTPSVQVT